MGSILRNRNHILSAYVWIFPAEKVRYIETQSSLLVFFLTMKCSLLWYTPIILSHPGLYRGQIIANRNGERLLHLYRHLFELECQIATLLYTRTHTCTFIYMWFHRCVIILYLYLILL